MQSRMRWCAGLVLALAMQAEVVLSADGLVRLDQSGKLVYRAYTEKGDKILDFSYCGYRRSEEPIPEVPVVVTVAPPDGEWTTDGSMAYPKGPFIQRAGLAAA